MHYPHFQALFNSKSEDFGTTKRSQKTKTLLFNELRFPWRWNSTCFIRFDPQLTRSGQRWVKRRLTSIFSSTNSSTPKFYQS